MRSRAPKSSPSDTRTHTHTHTHTHTQREREREERERRERERERETKQTIQDLQHQKRIRREFQAESAGLARPTVAAG